jgi:hypothetical protein
MQSQKMSQPIGKALLKLELKYLCTHRTGHRIMLVEGFTSWAVILKQILCPQKLCFFSVLLIFLEKQLFTRK